MKKPPRSWRGTRQAEPEAVTSAPPACLHQILVCSPNGCIYFYRLPSRGSEGFVHIGAFARPGAPPCCMTGIHSSFGNGNPCAFGETGCETITGFVILVRCLGRQQK